MLIDTLKAQERLTQEFGFDERRAKGIVELFSSAEDRMATEDDLQDLRREMQAMEERLKKMMWRVAVSILAANAAITAALLALFGFAA